MDEIINENYKYKLIKELITELIEIYNKSQDHIIDILKLEIKTNNIYLTFYDIITITLKDNFKYIKDYEKYIRYLDKQIIVLQKDIYNENFDKAQLK